MRDREPAIVADRLERRFGSFVAVDKISFQVAQGSVFGLLGANGAGKSTAIRMLCGLLEPSSGVARVAGIDVGADPEGVKRRIGYMSQKFSLYQDLTVRENGEFFGSLYGLQSPRGRKSLHPELERAFELTGITASGGVGSEAILDTLAGELSAGYRQRLALACAVAHRPGVLFLDEPTAGVDPLARRVFWDLIYAIAEAGTAVLVTTHYLDEAEYCSVVTMMRDGRIVATGKPGDLKKERFPGTVAEIECGDQDAVLSALRKIPAVEEASVFGPRVHAVLRVGATVDALRTELEAAGPGGLRLQAIEPSLEDAFIRIVSAKEEDRP